MSGPKQICTFCVRSDTVTKMIQNKGFKVHSGKSHLGPTVCTVRSLNPWLFMKVGGVIFWNGGASPKSISKHLTGRRVGMIWISYNKLKPWGSVAKWLACLTLARRPRLRFHDSGEGHVPGYLSYLCSPLCGKVTV